MKKTILLGIMTAGLLLFASCGQSEGVGPLLSEENGSSPTPIVVPTCTPTITPVSDPGILPTATPTKAPTATPTPSPSPEPTVSPTPSPEPTATPTPSPSPTPTPSPAPTATPTPSPEPTATPTPSPSPTPTINPEPLVANGWQKTVSIDGNYTIVFPELFRESEVSKTDRELISEFTCDEDTEITFSVGYIMMQTLEETVQEILAAGGIMVEERPEEQRVTYRWQTENKIYNGIFVEVQYPQYLLGNVFGEEEWITGVMQIVFSYPADQQEKYETEQYSYHVVENGEE